MNQKTFTITLDRTVALSSLSLWANDGVAVLVWSRFFPLSSFKRGRLWVWLTTLSSVLDFHSVNPCLWPLLSFFCTYSLNLAGKSRCRVWTLASEESYIWGNRLQNCVWPSSLASVFFPFTIFDWVNNLQRVVGKLILISRFQTNSHQSANIANIASQLTHVSSSQMSYFWSW